MDKVEFNLSEFLPYRLSVAADAVSIDFAKRYRKSHGLDRAEWRIICILAQQNEDNPSMSVRDLQKLVHLDKSKISRAASRLEVRGMVHKTSNRSDARLVEISLTQSGHEVFLKLAPLALQYHEALLANLSPEERQSFDKILKKLIEI